MKIYAVIPARGGSKGVPKKNIRRVAGFPLIAYSIAAAAMSLSIQRTIVSTDSEEIAAVALKFGANVPFLRPEAMAGDLSLDRDFVLHLLHWLLQNEGAAPDLLVHLRPTTPLRNPAIVDDAIAAIIANPEATSLRSGHEAPESPFKWFRRDPEGYFQSIVPAGLGLGDANLPRQLFPKVYIPDGYVDVLKPSYVLNSEDIHGHRMLGYVTPACIEVDTEADLEYLQFRLGKQTEKVIDFLKLHHPEV